MKKSVALFTALFVVILFSVPMFSVQTTTAAEERPRYGGILHVATLNDPHTLNAILTESGDDWNFLVFMHNALVSFKHDDKYRVWTPTPDLADSWNISSDGLTVTFYLNKDARWSDGIPLTSADVKFTYETALNYSPTGQQFFAVVDRCETPDNYTVVFRLKYQWESFYELWGFCPEFLPIIPKHIYEGTDILTNEHNWIPVTNGPFRFVEYVKGDHVTLERNPYYWKKDQWGNQLPYADKVIIHIVPSFAVMVAGLQTGEYQLAHTVPSADFKTLSETPNVEAIQSFSPESCQDMLYFNLRRPITGNLKVRQALAHVIEYYKLTMVETARLGLGAPSYSIHPCAGGTGKFCVDPFTDAEIPFYDGNITKANQLLDEAGYPRGADGTRFTVDYVVCNCRPEEVKIGEILKDSLLRDCGIDLELKVVDNPAWITRTYVDWDFDISVRTLCTGPTPDGLYSYYHKDMIVHLAFTNCFGYNNSYVSDLIVEAGKTVDPTRELELERLIQIQLLKDLPTIPMIAYSSLLAARTEFRGPGAYLGLVDDGWAVYRYGEWSHMWWTGGTPVPLPTTTTTPLPTTTTTPLPTDMTLYWIAGIVVVIVVVAAYLFYRTRTRR